MQFLSTLFTDLDSCDHTTRVQLLERIAVPRRCVENRVEAVSTAGAVKEVIEFPQIEGAPVFVAVNTTFMAVLTASLYLHVYNMKGRKARETSVGQVRSHTAPSIVDSVRLSGITCDS